MKTNVSPNVSNANVELDSFLNILSMNDDDWNKKVEDYFFAAYEYSKFVDAIDFHRFNNVYFDIETIADILGLFLEDLEKKGASQAVKKEVRTRIVAYIKDYKIECEPKKVMIQEIDDLYYFCIDLIRDASMNGKKSTSKKSVDDYYESFLDSIDKTKELGYNIDEGDVLYKMFQTIAKCKVEGGEFNMIDALYDKLGEYLEANY